MSDKNSSALEDVWMIRPCEVYMAEYQDCKRWKNRAVQYYVDGKMTDCSKWFNDFQNCIAFREKRDHMAAAVLVNVEKEKRKDRLAKAHANDVWEYRTSPPSEWTLPLHRQPPNGEHNEMPS